MLEPAEKMFLLLTGKTMKERSRKDRALKFPVKLMYTLECGDYDDIIRWCRGGDSFVITNSKRFEEYVLPDIFKEAKYASFDRKLKRWGFHKARVRKASKSCCYGHPMFLKGNFGLCESMTLIHSRQRSIVMTRFSSNSEPSFNNGQVPSVMSEENLLTRGIDGTSPSPPANPRFSLQEQLINPAQDFQIQNVGLSHSPSSALSSLLVNSLVARSRHVAPCQQSASLPVFNLTSERRSQQFCPSTFQNQRPQNEEVSPNARHHGNPGGMNLSTNHSLFNNVSIRNSSPRTTSRSTIEEFEKLSRRKNEILEEAYLAIQMNNHFGL
jgi:hypothetical protein